jgi:UDP-GlcNAc:undecaprenyl-phosphate GlcNAc-1-phosphate transferase
MYLWTATFAFPVSISAFTPLWVAGLLAAALLAFTIIFTKQGVKKSPEAVTA